MKKLFVGTYAPSTLGSFLRSFTLGHVRQLDAVARRWLVNLATITSITTGINDYALVDIDDTIKEVHGYQNQGSGYGHSGVRGLNAVIDIVSTPTRPGSCRPLSPSTSPALPAGSPAPTWAKRAPAPFAANSSTSQPDSQPQRGRSPCACPRTLNRVSCRCFVGGFVG